MREGAHMVRSDDKPSGGKDVGAILGNAAAPKHRLNGGACHRLNGKGQLS